MQLMSQGMTSSLYLNSMLLLLYFQHICLFLLKQLFERLIPSSLNYSCPVEFQLIYLLSLFDRFILNSLDNYAEMKQYFRFKML